MKIDYKIVTLQLEHPFGISRETITTQRTFIVSLGQDGFTGYGEATENRYYHTTVEGMEERLRSLKERISDYKLESAEEFWAYLSGDLKDLPFLHCAIDMAATDLEGKMKGQPVYAMWGLDVEAELPISNYTIALDSIDKMKEKLLEKPWPLYKVKLGTDHDIDIVRRLREVTDAPFRVDANAAWTAEETIRNAKELKELGVQFIEQPMPADAWEEMEEVYRQSALPLIADEACRTYDDIGKCVGRFHGINVKLVKAGGMTPARKMILEAKRLGLQTMVGCMTESSVGISGVCQFLPLLDYVDADGALLLKGDIAKGVEVLPTGYQFPKSNGTGVELIV